ncbi:hypothetical protein KY289_008066 [Solanum tuberosum]|nr:hypothetical protein KY289_008066 [Solanum tuberosum]
MTRGRGRGNTSRASKMSIGSRGSTSRVNMPTVPIPITSSQQGGISSSSGPNNIIQVQTLVPTISPPIPTSDQCSTPSVHLEPAPVIPNRSNAIGEGASTDQRNAKQHNKLEPSSTFSNRICESFKSELDPKGTNWKSVPQEIKDFYLGEFEKEFYWDPSIDSEVKIQWLLKMVAIQHQVRYICMSIHMVMMENLLLVNELKSCILGPLLIISLLTVDDPSNAYISSYFSNSLGEWLTLDDLVFSIPL